MKLLLAASLAAGAMAFAPAQVRAADPVVTVIDGTGVTTGSAARTCAGANAMAPTASDAASSSFKKFPAFINLPASEGPG